MISKACWLFGLAIVLLGAQPLLAALGPNIVTGGDFETPLLKQWGYGRTKTTEMFNTYTPQEQLYMGRANDLNYWINYYHEVTAYDDPRAVFAQFGNVPLGDFVGTGNVSLIDGNHVFETVGSRSSLIQVVAAPAIQAPGAASISFDYFWRKWSDDPNGPTRFRIQVFGLPSLPETIDTHFMDNDQIMGGVPGETLLWNSPCWDTQWTTWIDPSHITTPPEPPAWQTYSATFVLPQTYPYYYVRYHGVTYTDGHPYYWMYNNIPVDDFTLGLDNLSLRLPLTPLWGDVNLDGTINALDIGPFVNRLTTGAYQGEADMNKDGAVNALDIGRFVNCLTVGACPSGVAEDSSVPEPSVVSLLALSAIFVAGRRCRNAAKAPGFAAMFAEA